MKTYDRNTMGIEFENEFRSKCTTFSMAKFGKNLVTLTSRQDDYHKGTDFKYRGVRVDPTTYMSGKDNTMKFKSHIELRTFTQDLNKIIIKVEFGIRTGNKVRKFDEPVLVIGMNIPDLKVEWSEVMALLDKHTHVIMEHGISLYNKAIHKNGRMGVPA
jgi:hypothetical protein